MRAFIVLASICAILPQPVLAERKNVSNGGSPVLALSQPIAEPLADNADLDAAIARHGAFSEQVIQIYRNRVDDLETQDRPVELEALYRKMLAALQRETPVSEFGVSVVRSQLARFLSDVGRFDEAIAQQRLVLAFSEAKLAAAPDVPVGETSSRDDVRDSLVPQLTTLGDIEITAGNSAAADMAYARALQLASESKDPMSMTLARVHNQMAHFYGRYGRYSEAEPHARSALAVYSKTPFIAGSLSESKVKFNLAQALLGQGKADEASNILIEVEPFAKELPDNDPEKIIYYTTQSLSLSLSDGANYTNAVRDARYAVAMLDARRKARLGGTSTPGERQAAAKSLAGTGADPLAAAYAALAIADWQWAQPQAPREKVEFEKLNPALAAMLWPDTKPDPLSYLQSEAFVAVQKLQQSAAGQAMAEAAARAIAGTGPLGDLVAREQVLGKSLRSLDARRVATVVKSGDTGPIEAQIEAQSKELAAITDRLKAEYPDYAKLVSPEPLWTDEIGAQLAKTEALLLVAPVGNDVFSFAVSGDKVSWTRWVGGAAKAAKLVTRLRCRLDEAGCTSDEDLDPAADGSGDMTGIDKFYPRYDRAAAYTLYQKLIAPLETGLAGKTTLYATVTGPLSALPLAALVRSAPQGEAESNDPAVLGATQWLGDAYAFISLPSVSSFRAVKAKARVGMADSFSGYGAPTLAKLVESAEGVTLRGRGKARLRGASLSTSAIMRGSTSETPMANPDELRKLESLPGTARELTAMATALQSGSDAVHLGSAATETAIRADAKLASARVIAFATHGLLPSELAMGEPGLVFTPPAKASATDDGLLTASEAAQLRLSADWVILSACNTASTDGTPGAEGISSLARGFLYAGAQALLASHWRVSDDVTAQLTVETLSAAMADPSVTRAQALQRAMQVIRTGQRRDNSRIKGWQEHWLHPAAWAPFSLISSQDQ